MTPPKRPVAMSDDERANEHRRHRAPALGVPVDAYDDITAQYEGEDLERMRRARAAQDPAAAIAALERKHAALDKAVAVGFAETNAKLDTMLDYAAKSDAERERRSAREAEEREKKAQADAKAIDGKRRHAIALVSAFGVAIAGIIAAVVR